MINIIKTAIVTIVISFISGLLLDYYKNLAPRLLCNIRSAMPTKNNKRIRAYIITISNISSKTINKLTLNIQSQQTHLNITDAKITRGLKFDSSLKDNTLDVYIPFLSKNDKFSVTVYGDDQYAMRNKPAIVLRSPENFKQIDSLRQNGILALLFNIPKSISETISNTVKKPEAIVSDEKDDFTKVMRKPLGTEETTNRRNRKVRYGNKNPGNTKKALIIVVSIILLIFAGVLGKSYLKGASANTQTPDVETVVPNQSTDATNSSKGTTKNSNSKASSGQTTRNSGSKASSGQTTENPGSKASSGQTTENPGSKASSGQTTENPGSKASSGQTTENPGSKASSGQTTGGSDPKASSGQTTGNSDPKASSGQTTGGSNSGTSSGQTTQSSGN
ncbi:hypothetical protein CLCOS_23340 [Clostridium coskatii]|uniref:Uncharacterized protein n=1 Tax=Clostridium coskatii TaxID=1705578 RepID=A0ABX2WUB2_9CLOT|nr:hypothetical protein [Clostridium coskatii]OBR93571.1 hypothetical protein CLCOS_23340 [Clostridium coskatii]